MPKLDEKQNASNDNANNENATIEETDANTDDNGASEDTHSDVQYVTLDAFNEMKDTIASFQETMNIIMGGIKSIRDAQGVMVRAGMVVQDDSKPEPIDDFKPLSELDFTIKR